MGTDLTPTSTWLAAAPELPVLTGPASTAERLLLLLHYGIDWRDGWVGRRAIAKYWDSVLPNRVLAATYRAPTLRQWWSEVAGQLESEPRNSQERAEAATLMGADSMPVLHVLRFETEALTLRTRIVAERVRLSRTSSDSQDVA